MDWQAVHGPGSDASLPHTMDQLRVCTAVSLFGGTHDLQERTQAKKFWKCLILPPPPRRIKKRLIELGSAA